MTSLHLRNTSRPRSISLVSSNADCSPVSIANDRLISLSGLDLTLPSSSLPPLHDDGVSRAPPSTPVNTRPQKTTEKSFLRRELQRPFAVLAVFSLLFFVIVGSVAHFMHGSEGLLLPLALVQIFVCLFLVMVASMVFVTVETPSNKVREESCEIVQDHAEQNSPGLVSNSFVRLGEDSVELDSPPSLETSSSNAPILARAEVSVGEDTVLTVRSWWSPHMMTEDVLERRAKEVAEENAKKWIDDRSHQMAETVQVPREDQDLQELMNQFSCACRSGHCAICLDGEEEDEEEGDGVDAENASLDSSSSSSSLMQMHSCGHTYHKSCVTQWFQKSGRFLCPLCREDMGVHCDVSVCREVIKGGMSADEYVRLVRSIRVLSVKVFLDGVERDEC